MLIPLSDENDDRGFPLVNILILLACVTLFVIQCLLPEKSQGAWIDTLAFDTRDYFGAWYASLSPAAKIWASLKTLFTAALKPAITSAFMHANIAHLLGNMLFLWIFGDNVEHAMGRLRYLAFFLLAAVLALWAQIVIGGAGKYVYLGASGAISAVMGAYLFYYPRAIINLYFIAPSSCDADTELFLSDTDRDDDPHLRWTARTYLLICFAMQVVTGLMTWGSAYFNVAVWAHVGGYVFGFALARIFKDPAVIFKQDGDRMFGSAAGGAPAGEYREYIFGARFKNPARKTVHKRPPLSEMRKKGDAEAKRRKRLGSDWMKPGKK